MFLRDTACRVKQDTNTKPKAGLAPTRRTSSKTVTFLLRARSLPEKKTVSRDGPDPVCRGDREEDDFRFTWEYIRAAGGFAEKKRARNRQS